ncbi:MAG TPA: helix-turn-helix domain-containing protein [Candidatus Sulfotelmatobacter sp.]|nr:helix-turn-helix domain-containing protein [Candidatus Sulfotelmatobacter sp.]
MMESRYRESRICRVLGNPVVYAIVRALDEGGPMSPSAIAGVVRRRIQTVSGHLATLRASDLVRYDRKGRNARYWIKHAPETRRLLGGLNALVRASARVPD